jgi:hypothetical protein
MAVFRKSAAEKIDDEYLSMNYCGDWLFWTMICMRGNIFISGKYLNYYRRHSLNVASSAEKEGLDFIEGNKIFQYILKHIQVGKESINKAVQMKIERYFQLEPVFKNEEVKLRVKQSLENLDKSFKSAFITKKIEKGFRYSLSKIKKTFFSL